MLHLADRTGSVPCDYEEWGRGPQSGPLRLDLGALNGAISRKPSEIMLICCLVPKMEAVKDFEEKKNNRKKQNNNRTKQYKKSL